MTYEGAVTSPVAYVVKKLQRQKKLRIKDLMARTGLARATVARHLSGEIEPNYENRVKYAKALGILPEEFEKMWQEEAAAAEARGEESPARESDTLDLVEIDLPAEMVDWIEAEAARHGVSVPKLVSAMASVFEGTDKESRRKLIAEVRAANEQTNEPGKVSPDLPTAGELSTAAAGVPTADRATGDKPASPESSQRQSQGSSSVRRTADAPVTRVIDRKGNLRPRAEH